MPAAFSTSSFSLPPKPNSAAVMSLSASNPAQVKFTVRGFFPAPGLTDNPLHRGGLLVGVGVSVGVAEISAGKAKNMMRMIERTGNRFINNNASYISIYPCKAKLQQEVLQNDLMVYNLGHAIEGFTKEIY